MTKDQNNPERQLANTKRLMGALLRMPPKPHEEMRLGKPRHKTAPAKARVKKTKPNR
jgi:hypothetical protein